MSMIMSIEKVMAYFYEPNVTQLGIKIESSMPPPKALANVRSENLNNLQPKKSSSHLYVLSVHYEAYRLFSGDGCSSKEGPEVKREDLDL